MQQNSFESLSKVEPNQKAPRIGFFIESLAHAYNLPLFTGIHDAVKEQGANLTIFAGSSLDNTRDYEYQGNIIYEFVDKNNIDGLIMFASITETAKNLDFFKRFFDIPLVTVSWQIDDIPNIIVDNEQGMHDLLVHLINQHGYRRLAFIKGTEGIPDAESRYNVYLRTLAEFGIPFDPDLVVQGRFGSRDSAAQGVRTLLDERKVKCDAIVAANDVLAGGALSELQAHGIVVPIDLALVGYDDQYWAKSILPSLTTVRQPAYKMGKKAVEMVLAIINGQLQDRSVSFPNEMVIRQSCGCLSQAVLNACITLPLSMETLETGLLMKREVIIAEINQILSTENKTTDPMWPEQLLESLVAEIKNEAPRKFLMTLNYIMDQLAVIEYNVMLWQEIISVLRRYTIPCIQDDSELFRIESILQQGRVLIAEVAQRIQTSQSAQTDRQAYNLGKVSEVIQTTFDITKLTKVVIEEFPKLGIARCYLSLYETSEAPLEWSRLIMAFDETGQLDLGEEGIRFPTKQLLPEAILENLQATIVVEPLFFREEQLGFVIFNIDPKQHQIYDSLRILLSSAIKGAELVKELTKKESELEQRADSLIRSNAELEQFAYVASHDLQEPLRMVASYLQLLERRYKGKLDSNADEFIGFAVDGAVRMQNLINDLLSYSRVSTRGKPFEQIDCLVALERVLSNLKIVIEETETKITNEALPTVSADPNQLVQLFQNLIANAIKFRSEEPPEIQIKAKHQNDGWLFSFSDNGIGLDMQHAERIFLIFQRLHSKGEYPGTGIGLAVCKRIVERHNGRIWVVSELGKGATFYFTIRTEGGIPNESE